jgi:hypothetical protein
LKDRRIVVAMGTDGLGVGVVKVQASDGAVVFLGMVASGGDGTDETGELRFDVDNDGDWVNIVAEDVSGFGIRLRDNGTGGIGLTAAAGSIDLFSELDMTVSTDTGANLSTVVRGDWQNDIRGDASVDIDGDASWNGGGTSDYTYEDAVTVSLDPGVTYIFKDGSGNPILTLTG